MPSGAISWAAFCPSDWPRNVMLPLHQRMAIREMHRRSELLPAVFGPISATTSAAPTSSDTS
jgi:hypothetical protein